jgi:Carboxypeptidase regulatory-like domain/TonB-dependent Receptor Plug Domain
MQCPAAVSAPIQTAALMFSLLTVAGLLLTGGVPVVVAQGIITGGITGAVVDPTGAAIPGAIVEASNESTGVVLKIVTSATGAFQISNVPLGSYRLTFSGNGFSKSILNHVTVVAGNATPIKAVLSLGSTLQTVEVEGAAAELINTESSQVETTISAEQLASAPVTGALDNLALASPGIVNTHADANSNTNGVNFSVNGQRGRSNNSEIDGQTNNDTSIGGPSFFFDNQDAIQEVQVLTTDMSAQYGRNMGAIVNYITKSGTNAFHGTGFEIYTGSWLSSLTQGQKAPQDGYCTGGVTTDCVDPVVPKFVQNNWGGTFGGPILKDRLWFFGSTLWSHTYEGGQTLTSAGGLFPDSNGMATLKGAFPNNPAVAAITANGPYSTSVGNPSQVPGTAPQVITVTDGTTVASVEVSQFQRTFPDVIQDQEHLGRIDYQLSSKDRFYLRYNYQNNPYNPAFYLTASNVAAAGAYPNVNGISHEVGGDWAHTFTPSITNQLRYAFQQSSIGFYGGSIPSCTITNQDSCSSFVGLGGSLAGYGYDFAGVFPQGRIIKVNQFQDNASILKGRHTLSFGGEFDSQHSPWGWLPNDEGAFNFAPNAAINAANPNGIPFNYPATGCGAGGANCDNGLTGFLEGIGQLTLSEGSPTIPFKENDFDLYFQDDFKVTSSLTLNLGLRYEFFGQAINFLHNETVERQLGSNPFWNTSLPLSATTIPSLPSDLRNIEPRIGFAYKPSFAPKLVVHGGYSINADPEFYSIFVNLATAAPAVNAGAFACDGVTVTCVPSGGLTFATVQAADSKYIPTGGDPRLLPTQTVTSSFHNPQGETYSLGFQYQVFPSAVAEARYVGNHTYGNFQAVNSNPDILDVQSAFPSYGAGTSVCTDPTAIGYTRPNCNYGPVETYGNTAFSLYDALQTSLTMRNFHGFSGIFSYTWSRTVDNTDDFSISINNSGGGGQASPIAQNPLNTNLGERGVSGNSYPNIWGIQLTYTEPWFHEQRGILGRLLGGYMLNGFYQFNGGQSYNPLQVATTVQSSAVLSDIAGTGSISPVTAALINPTEAGQGFCDLGFVAAGFASSCRPVLANSKAPLQSVGINLGPAGYVDYVTGNPVSRSSEHWIWSNQYEALALNNPFPGVGRNILRGDSWNDFDLSGSKTFKIAERVNLQIIASAFDLFNRAYYGTPDLNIEHSLNSPATFETTLFTGPPSGPLGSGAGGGSYPQGLGNRNIQLTGKIIF